MKEFVVARAADIEPGTGAQLDVDGRAVAVFNVEGRFYAIGGTCVHRGGPVGDGDLEGTTVTCPWHGYQYDVTTGELIFDRAVRLQPFVARVVDGDVVVEFAETS